MKKPTSNMKLLIGLGLGLMVSANALGQAVYSLNQVGILRVKAGGQENEQVLTASPFNQGANTLDELVGDQADANADSFIFYDGQKFRKCIRLPDGVAGHEGKAGRWVDAATYELVTTDLGPGKGMIFEDRAPTLGQDLVFVGEVIDAATRTIALPGVGKYTLLSYPFSTDRDLNIHPLNGAVPFLGDKVEDGEKIYVFDKASQLYTVYLYNAAQSKWIDPKTKAPAVKSIKSGEGFFFVSNPNAATGRISIEAIPYDLSTR